ncbi:MAG: tRNA lysidine(34) synthetase TilS [Gammaproteobacteria bacterium]|nr:tRNA lysidine(34) synthetase TilS [Gammaproteobacteria bacterium]
MSFEPEDLLSTLAGFETVAGKPRRFVVAFSGGIDSTALLSVLAATRDVHNKSLLAVHVDHQLHAASTEWTKRAGAIAKSLQVEFVCETVSVADDSGLGPEAAAREARYAALAAHVTAHTWLLSAHHRDDQAETLLLNLLRGSGPTGVAGIPALREFRGGWIARPLLKVPRHELSLYVDGAGLTPVNDPSNDDDQFDRNFLRNELMPVLRTRWPNAGSRLARSSDYAREAAELLAEVADSDIATLGGVASRLPVSKLRALSRARQINVIKRAVEVCMLGPIPSTALQRIIGELLTARADAAPLVSWRRFEARRYRDILFLLESVSDSDYAGREFDGDSLDLGEGMGVLRLVRGGERGLSQRVIDAGLLACAREGGEEIKTMNQPHTRKLKKLLQEHGVVPWMRDRIPLLYSNGELVAVADLWLASGATEDNGYRIEWQDKPPLH